MKAAIFAVALLSSFAATAADNDGDCQSDIPNPIATATIQLRASRLLSLGDMGSNPRTGTPSVGPDAYRPAVKALRDDIPKRWTCSKDGAEHCCKKIPVDVFVDGTACFVTFPYGELDISTVNGTKTPRVAWELRVERSAAILFPYGYAFDKTAGIKLAKSPGVALPAKGGDHDSSDKRYKLDSTGVVGDHAGHGPTVYPKKSDGSLDLASECTPWDPTMTNTN